MRADEIREMGSEDITSRIRELEEERFRLKFRSATEPLEDPLRLRVIRKDVARLKTILHQRTQGGGTGDAGDAGRGTGEAEGGRAGAKGKATSAAAVKKTATKRGAKKSARASRGGAAR
jgi:large subunit ribosomal protein L29